VSLLLNNIRQLLFIEYCENSLFILYEIYCSSGTVVINLNHLFLIKRLRGRERHRHCSPLPFTPEGRGSEPR
jgi:hypothetical protein